jgi:phosphomannomutase
MADKLSKTIILFDMDGTLTKSRQPFNKLLLSDHLYSLTNLGVSIGIITGSDEDYLYEQMGDFLTNSSCRYKLHLLPCNGTKHFIPPKFATENHKLVHSVSMEEELGVDNYRTLLKELVYSQIDMCNENIPLTGHFINCRGSMINWCPIGRNANLDEREEFIAIDNKIKLRYRVLEELKTMLKQKKLFDKIVIKYGGDTSFDIYPKGWDKTYGLRHFQGWNVWFVGDRCGISGNDHEIYLSCSGKSYETNGPEQTRDIINTIIQRLRKNNE